MVSLNLISSRYDLTDRLFGWNRIGLSSSVHGICAERSNDLMLYMILLDEEEVRSNNLG